MILQLLCLLADTASSQIKMMLTTIFDQFTNIQPATKSTGTVDEQKFVHVRTTIHTYFG